MHVLRPKTVAESHAETTRMARRLFVSPPAQRMVLPILAFSLMESFLLIYPSVDGWRVVWGAVAIAIPAYIAAYATVPLAERLGGRMNFRRSFLLVFVSLIMVGAIELAVVAALTLYSVLGTTTYAFRIDRAVVLGYGAVLWIRAVILTATSNSRYVRTLPAASLHPVLGLVGLAVFARLVVWDIVMAFVSGSDLPSKIARGLTDLTPNVLVAHGPTTHDENPATTAEVKKVSEAVREMVGAAAFGPKVGSACRVTYARASALAQAFGDVVLIVASFAPNPTDDIDSATGHAAVQFDGNNMVPGIRDEIRLRLAGLVQESEAMTSDNHSVNLSMDGFNAVGAALDQQTILAQAERAVREAIANLEETEVAAFATEIANFRIFGPQSASRLTTSINSTMAVLRPALYVTLSGAIALGALVIVLF